jgi:hypothetical protein
MFAAMDKLHCVLPAEYLPGYVEWLTCLEMELEFRKIRNNVAANGPPQHSPVRGTFAGSARFRE